MILRIVRLRLNLRKSLICRSFLEDHDAENLRDLVRCLAEPMGMLYAMPRHSWQQRVAESARESEKRENENEIVYPNIYTSSPGKTEAI